MAVDPKTEQTSPLADISIDQAANADAAWAMVEAAPDALVMVDEQGLIELINGQAESLFGYERIELLGKPVETLLPDRFRQVHSAHRVRFSAAPAIRSMGNDLDLKARRADGSEIPVEVSLSPVLIDGRTRTIAAVRDISARVSAEAQARLIQTTIDATHDGVFMFRPDTLQFTYVNQGAVNQTGYSRSELLKMTPLHIKPLFTRKAFVDLLKPLVEGRIPRHSFETVHRSKDGIDVPVEIILEYPAETDTFSGRVLIALVRNIAERIEAEAREQAVHARFRSAFGDGPVPMAIVEISPDADRIILETNQAMAQMLGYSVTELLGRSFLELTHPEDQAQDDAATHRQVTGEQESFISRKRYVRSDGSHIWVQIHVSVLSRVGDRVTTIGHSIDVSAEVEAQRQHDRDQESLEALADVRATLLAKHSTEEILGLICRRARTLVGADTVTFSRLNESETSLIDLAHDGGERQAATPEPSVVARALRIAHDGTAWKTGGEGNSEDPDTEHCQVRQPAMVVPVIGNDGVAGVLLILRTNGKEHFGDDELLLISGFASSAATALQADEAGRRQQRTELLEDRERIGRDMHDLVIGRLFATGMALQATAARIADPDAKKRIQAAVDEIDTGIKEIRTSIYGLHSQQDWGKGARGELLAVAAELKPALGFEPHVVMSGPIDNVDETKLAEAFAALREALTNAAKHADSTSVEITIKVTDERFTMTIVDDGKGFNSLVSGDKAITSQSLSSKGLHNMNARATALGGHTLIKSAESQGTTVVWSVPL